MKTMLFNPYTGTPRHPDDIKSDPQGLLIVEPDAPIHVAPRFPADINDNQPRAPQFRRLALRKLADLQAKGHTVCGVMIQRTEPDGAITRGAVSDGGMVIWWHPEQASSLPWLS